MGGDRPASVIEATVVMHRRRADEPPASDER